MNQNRIDDERTTRIVTLDFNGGSHVYRNSELGMNIPVRIAPSGISADRARTLAEALNRDCADSHVRFEVGVSSEATRMGKDGSKSGASKENSTVRIGRTADFNRYGAFLGLAEGIGSGDAYVLLDDSAKDAELVDVIRHEAGHILGTLDHGGAGLARYAWKQEIYNYHHGFAYLANEYPDRYKILLSEVKTTNFVVKPVVAQSGEDYLVVSYKENGTTVEYNYSAVSLNSEATTEYITQTDEREIYLASGIWARTIYVYGGTADHCSAANMTVSGSYDYDLYARNTPYRDGESFTKYSNYKFYQGLAIGCDVTSLPDSDPSGILRVTGNGVAKQCTAYKIVVRGESVESYHEYYRETTDSPTIETMEYKLFNGRAENCTVDGGSLEVKFGGIANDTIVKCDDISDRGWAVIGSDEDIAKWRKEAERLLEEGIEDPYVLREIEMAEADFAQYGSAKANNLIVEGSVGVYYGGELHNARIDGCLFAGEGASLSGVITCESVDISNVVPKTNITIKVDLNDYKVANYTEYLRDEDGNRTATVKYYADFTTRTYHFRDGKLISVTEGTFDKKDAEGRFDMSGWKYSFDVTIGSVDEKALPYIVVDFGGTEKGFDGGKVHFSYPSTTHDIQFQLKGNSSKWQERWGQLHESEDAYWGEIVYDATIFGEAEDVLWLENGWDEEAEYTVVLPDDIMRGATEELTVTDKGSGNDNAMSEAELKGGKLVFKGGVDSGTYTVKAEEKNGVDHTCELDLWVIPEEIPVIGKAGTKRLAEILKKMQTDGVYEFSVGLPHNIHTDLYGMPFDLSDTAITVTADFPQKTFSAKIQGKIEWKLNKDTAGTGKQLKLVVDLSGDNYISITNTKGKYDWDLVGEFKIPDFKLGKFEFSNMAMKVDVGKSSYSASAYVKLPWIKYAFGGSIGFSEGYWDSMAIGVDSLNVPLGSSGLFLQKIEGGISGIATELNLTFQGTLGLTAGPTFKVEYVDWLGIDSGEYSLCEITVIGTLTTNGNLSGEAETSILGGFITGGGGAGIKDGEFFSKGKYTLLNGCITVDGELRAGLSGITITGKGKMTVPAEKIFGPLAGMTLTVNAEASINVQNPDASYVKAWSDFAVMGYQVAMGFKYSFNKGLELTGCDDEKKDGGGSPKRSLYALNPVLFDLSPEFSLRGAAEPSASKTFTVTGSGLTLFQVNLSVSDATMSLAFGGVEYTQADIAAGLYENMRIVAELSGLASELSGANCITVAVNDAALGEWTVNAYGDAEATFNAYSLLSTAPAPVLIAVEVGEDARSATLRYTADFSDLTDATISIFRADAGTTDFTSGSKIAEIAAADATGVYEYVMPDEVEGGDYLFYLAVNSDGRAPVYSAVSDVYTFRILDTEAPDQIQAVNSEWKSSGTVLTWEAPWDDRGVAGYKIRYAAGDEDMAEVDLKANTFMFDKVPNGTYDFQVAAYDEADNLSEWSEQQSCLVLTVANATYKNMTLTEDLELGEYESAVGIAGGEFSVTAAANSLISGSALGDAGISGIVENTSINGAANLYNGAEAYNLTINGDLTVGGATPIDPDAALIAAMEEFPDDFERFETEGEDGEEDNGTEASAETQEEAVVIKESALLKGATVSGGGRLVLESGAQAQDITVETDGTLVLKAGAEYSGLALDYGTSLIIVGNNNGGSSKYLLTDDIHTAGTISSHLYLDANGHKIRFEQYKQSAEYVTSDDELFDNISFLPDMDRLLGDALEMEIDSTVHGKFRIADKAKYFNGTITVVDHVQQTSVVVGLDEYAAVGHSLCRLKKYDNGLYLETVRGDMEAPTITVDYAENNKYGYVELTGLEAENSGAITDYVFRYSLKEDMSDAVSVSTTGWSWYVQLNKEDLVDNATYYAQVSVKNEYGVTSPWSDVVSFTVTPKVYPAAPPPVTVTDATNSQASRIIIRVLGLTENISMIRGYRFRYADNPEMENAVTVTNNTSYESYLFLDKSEITDGTDYYIQASVQYGSDWSYWSDAVVFNTQGWDYDGITVGPDGDYASLDLSGKRAKNITVVEKGYFYGGKGLVDGLTVDGGFFRDDGATVTNAVVNGGEYDLDTGSVTDIVVNGGELYLLKGTLNGATIGANGRMNLDRSDYTPKLNGTILIQGQFTIYSGHPDFSTNAEFIFDVGAHEAAAMRDKMFIDNLFRLGGNSKFTLKLDDTPEIGDYRICNLYIYGVEANALPLSLVANDGTRISDLKAGESPVFYNGLYYSLIDQKGTAYLHISDNTDPVFLGKFKFYKDGTMYDSGDSCNDLTVSADSDCDYLLAENGAFLQRVNIGKGGSVDLFGDVNGATIWNGGLLTMKEGSTALMHDVCIQKGGTVVIEGGSVATDAVFQIAGTLTVDGILHSYEQDDQWGSSSHWFELRLDQLDAPAENVMISNYANLQCNPVIRVVVSTRQAKGEYKLVGNASSFSESISIRFDDVSNWSEYLYVGGESTFNGTKYSLALKNDILTLTVGGGTGPGPGPDDPGVPDGENDNLFDETGKPNDNVEDNPLKCLDDTTIVMDTAGSVSEGEYNNYVGGTEDKADYAKITLEKAAKLSFTVNADSKVKLTFYQLVENKKKPGTYTKKVLKSVSISKAKGDEKSTASVLVEGGEDKLYYVAVENKNSQSKGAYYNVSLTTEGKNACEFFADGDNGDNNFLWNKTDKWNEKVHGEEVDALVIDSDDIGKAIQIDTDAETVVEHDGFTNFVGFGDAMDFRKIELKSAAKLSFDLAKTTGGAAKLVVYTENDKGKMVVANSKLTVTTKAAAPSGSVKNPVVLQKGVYYIAVQSTDAKKGKEAYYNVSLNENSVFYEHGDLGKNNFISKTKKVDDVVRKDENALTLHVGDKLRLDGLLDGETEINETKGGIEYLNFVGTGDDSDVARINANDGMKLSLKVTATDAVSLVIYGLQKNGTLKALKTVKSKDNVAVLNDFELKAKSAPGGQFFLGVNSTNAKKGSAVYYNVDVVNVSGQNPPLSSSEASSLAMPETDNLAISDALSFGQYDADVLASASASSLAELDDKSAWLNIASLA